MVESRGETNPFIPDERTYDGRHSNACRKAISKWHLYCVLVALVLLFSAIFGYLCALLSEQKHYPEKSNCILSKPNYIIFPNKSEAIETLRIENGTFGNCSVVSAALDTIAIWPTDLQTEIVESIVGPFPNHTNVKKLLECIGIIHSDVKGKLLEEIYAKLRNTTTAGVVEPFDYPFAKAAKAMKKVSNLEKYSNGITKHMPSEIRKLYSNDVVYIRNVKDPKYLQTERKYDSPKEFYFNPADGKEGSPWKIDHNAQYTFLKSVNNKIVYRSKNETLLDTKNPTKDSAVLWNMQPYDNNQYYIIGEFSPESWYLVCVSTTGQDIRLNNIYKKINPDPECLWILED